jgi:hypothetical protein
MAIILTLLITAPFLSKRLGFLLVLYALTLLVASEIFTRLLEVGSVMNGKGFFEYQSSVQLAFVLIAAMFLTGWQRLSSIAVHLVFSFYNLSICWFWGIVPIWYYDLVSEVVVFIQIGIVTMEQRPKTWVLMFGASMIVYYTTSKYIN